MQICDWGERPASHKHNRRHGHICNKKRPNLLDLIPSSLSVGNENSFEKYWDNAASPIKTLTKWEEFTTFYNIEDLGQLNFK